MNKNLTNTVYNSLLIVESSQDETKRFIDILQIHCDTNISTFDNSIDAILWLQTNYTEAIVLEDNMKPMGALETSEYIRNELKLETPIFISTNNSQLNNKFKLQKPFTFKSLLTLINRDVLHEETKEIKQYSLEYLKEISGNNTEFINGSLEIFIKSVAQQLHEIDKAASERDFEKIKKIAHNIKPSFEMLLNEKATKVCNTLTYDLNTSEFLPEIEEIKRIYIQIKEQIDSDFNQMS